MPITLDNTSITGLGVGGGIPANTLSGRVPAANAPSGSVIQVQSTVLNGRVSSTQGGSPFTITSGVQIFSLAFTPISATSTILVLTGSVSIYETTNVGNRMWMALWNGANYVAANSGTRNFDTFLAALNGVYTSIAESFSAGSTNTRTIQIRAGADGTGLAYINGQGSSNYVGTSAQVRMIVMEIAA